MRLLHSIPLVCVFQLCRTVRFNVTIGIIFDGYNSDVEKAVQLRLEHLNHQSLNLVINTVVLARKKLDFFTLSQEMCKAINQGMIAIFNSGDAITYLTSNAMSEAFEVPYYNWNNLVLFGGKSRKFELNVRPQYTEVVADVIVKHQWNTADYLYENEQGLTRMHQLTATLLGKGVKSFEVTPVKIVSNDLRNFFTQLHEAKKFDIHKIIVDITSQDLHKQIVEMLVEKSQTTRNIHYLFANSDLSQKHLNQFKLGFMNVTGMLQMHRDQLIEFKQELRDSGLISGDIDMTAVAYACDSVSLFFNTLDYLVKKLEFRKEFFPPDGIIKAGKEHPTLCGIASNENSVLPMGKTITRTSKKLRFTEALSGHVELDDSGKRRRFALDVIDLTFTRQWDCIESVSKWTDEDGFLTRNSSVSYHRRAPGLIQMDKPRIITTAISAPFVMVKEGEFSGNERYEGYAVDLIELLFKKILHIPYVIKIVNDSKFGNENNGKWDGMVGELLRGEADAAVSSLVITKARQTVVAFSKPFMSLGLSIMLKKPEKTDPNVFAFMSPLSTEIWMYIIFAYVCVSIVIFVVSRFNAYEWLVEDADEDGFTVTNDFNIWNCLWFTLAAFMQQGIDILPRSIAGRIASATWWFFTMIIVSSYTANLAAFCTLEAMQSPINSVEDLGKQTKIKYGIQHGGSSESFFKDSTVQTYQRMWLFMSAQNPPVTVSSYAKGIAKVRESKGRYAFLLESTANNYENTREPCDTMKVGTELNSVGYGVATTFDSDLRDPINLAVLELLEKGELKKLENKWWFDRGQCKPEPQDAGNGELIMGKVAGVFYILVAGMVLGMFGALLEFLYKARLEARKIGGHKEKPEEDDIEELKDLNENLPCTTIV